MLSVEQLYADIWAEEGSEIEKALELSRNPRPRALLYDLFGALGVGSDSMTLDIGCRDASFAIKLVQRFGGCAVGVDPIPIHLEWAAHRIQEAALEEKIAIRPGRIEAIPAEDASFDYIWSRDMLNHVDLPAGFAECARVLRPGGVMFVYVTLEGTLMEPAEAQWIYQSQAIVPQNMSPAYLEAMAHQSGLRLRERHMVGSEWWEADLESAANRESLGKSCLLLSRLRRGEVEFVERFGKERYDAMVTGELWGLYIVLGKLCPMIYVLEKPA
jgi:SAM-dependent methyltransferase